MQFVLTPAAGKRLIGKALAAHPAVQAASRSAPLVIVAGTTNGYVAEEILKGLGQRYVFSKKRLFRCIVLLLEGPMREWQLMNGLHLPSLATSLGSVDTLAEHPASKTHAVVPKEMREEMRERMGIADCLVRVSVGVEDREDIVADFAQGLEELI